MPTPVGVDLWMTDGTAAGTRLVKSSQDGGGFDPKPMGTLGDSVVFSVLDSIGSGVELWISDGTALGTHLVQDINPGPDGSDPGGFVEIRRLPGSEPTNITLSKNTVAEAVADGTVVGKLNAADPDGNDGFTYLVLDDAGGRFAVSGGKLVVADGLSLDFEQNASYSVQVQVTDGA